MPLYESTVHSLFEFCMQFWSSYSIQNILTMKKIQEAVIMMKDMEQLLYKELWSSYATLQHFRKKNRQLGMREYHGCLKKSG